MISFYNIPDDRDHLLDSQFRLIRQIWERKMSLKDPTGGYPETRHDVTV